MEMGLQIGLAKAVGKVLHDDFLMRQRRHGLVDVRAFRSRQEKGRGGLGRDVLDMDHWLSRRSEIGNHLLGHKTGLQAPVQFHATAGEVVVLDIDDEERAAHGSGASCML